MTNTQPTAEEIQARMREVRSNVDEEVERFVEAARAMTDWRHYVRRFPWFCLGAAAAVGYLCVRSKRIPQSPDAQQLVESVREQRLAAMPAQSADSAGSVAATLIRIAAPLVIRAGIAVLERRSSASANRPRSQSADDSQRTGGPSAPTNDDQRS